MRSGYRAWACVVALALASVARVDADAAISQPFELANDHVFVDVSLDGTGPYHFVVDSGSPFGLLDTEVARELELVVRPHGTIGGVGDREASAGLASARVMRIGELAIPRARFVVTDLHGTIATAEGRAVDGVIGRDVLANFVTTFDYANRTIVFGTDVPPQATGGATVLPMHLAGGIPQVACRIAGFRATCNVDTGSRLALTITAPFAATHPSIVPASRSAVGIDGFGLGGPALGRFGRVRSLALGDIVLRDVLCDFSTQTRGAFAAPNIGGGVLKEFTVTFDFTRRRLILRRNAGATERGAIDRSGLFLVTDGAAISVLGVRPMTPAARAGIARGDRILAIDNRPTRADDLAAIRTRLSVPEDEPVSLRIERDGVAREVSFALADYITPGV